MYKKTQRKKQRLTRGRKIKKTESWGLIGRKTNRKIERQKERQKERAAR